MDGETDQPRGRRFDRLARHNFLRLGKQFLRLGDQIVQSFFRLLELFCRLGGSSWRWLRYRRWSRLRICRSLGNCRLLREPTSGCYLRGRLLETLPVCGMSLPRRNSGPVLREPDDYEVWE